MATYEQSGHGWTVVLRRQPARIVDGHAQGPYTDMFEIICCDCGDDPGLDYRDVAPHLQLTRGPYPLRDGVAAYNQHLRLHQKPAPAVDASSHPYNSVRSAQAFITPWSSTSSPRSGSAPAPTSRPSPNPSSKA